MQIQQSQYQQFTQKSKASADAENLHNFYTSSIGGKYIQIYHQSSIPISGGKKRSEEGKFQVARKENLMETDVIEFSKQKMICEQIGRWSILPFFLYAPSEFPSRRKGEKSQ